MAATTLAIAAAIARPAMTGAGMVNVGGTGSDEAPLLEVKDLVVEFQIAGPFLGLGGGKRVLHAVSGVDLTVRAGECLGLVGESGCGKTTVALAILGLVPATRGAITIDGMEIGSRRSIDRRRLARTVQMVFQDPYASLNPRQTVRRTLIDPLRLHGLTNAGELEDRVADMLRRVGLTADQADRYPHEFSGGQRQRIGIARALILRPRLVICDEPVSALDVSIRAQIINLLLELKESLGLAYIMISHDLGVVEHMSDRVAVMYFGKIVETGEWRAIFERPGHPYTRGLIAAIPDVFAPAGVSADKVRGEIPSPFDPPAGCAFHPRCPIAVDQCRAPPGPELRRLGTAHEVSCWRAS
jgi:peptide/nickel transport system ATP-binding protein